MAGSRQCELALADGEPGAVHVEFAAFVRRCARREGRARFVSDWPTAPCSTASCQSGAGMRVVAQDGVARSAASLDPWRDETADGAVGGGGEGGGDAAAAAMAHDDDLFHLAGA